MSQRFLENHYGCTNVSCSCHAVHLCHKKPCERLIPADILQLNRDIYNYLNTPKRRKVLKQQQIELDLDVHVLLRDIYIRWLSRGPSIDRTLQQWEAIHRSLMIFNNINPSAQLTDIINRFERPITKCYLFFLSFTLKKFEDLNGCLQTEEIILPDLYGIISTVYKQFLECFIQPQFLQNAEIENVDIDNRNLYLD